MTETVVVSRPGRGDPQLAQLLCEDRLIRLEHIGAHDVRAGLLDGECDRLEIREKFGYPGSAANAHVLQ